MDPDRTELPWRFGNTHGFCVTGGLPPIASEPTPSPRLWATPPGATPAGLCEHTMRADRRLSIPELSTLAGIGTFYFGPTLPPEQPAPPRCNLLGGGFHALRSCMPSPG